MKKTAYILAAIIMLASCSKSGTQYDGSMPDIYPDYIGVTFPAEMAPLNFNLKGDHDKLFVQVSGRQGKPLKTSGKYARFGIRKWQALAEANRGDTLTFRVLAKDGGQWTQYRDFKMFVSPYALEDFGVTYRKFAPGYETYSKIGIYQRNIHNYRESAIIEGNLIPGQCVGCHTANRTDPEQFLFHIRGKHGATYMQLEGKHKLLNTKTDSTISNAVYSYWHPSGDYVAHSNNFIHQLFWTGENEHYVEVFDDASDVIVHNVRTDEYILDPRLMTKDYETYPAFSSDGKTLYYCSAKPKNLPAEAQEVRYSLCSIAFDSETETFGGQIDTLVNAKTLKKSVTFPRPSYDGKWLLYSLADFGNFPINHMEADLWIMNLSDGTSRPATEANSRYDESFHNWSSDSHWFLVASRRDDSLYSQIYFSSIDDEGNVTKPFVLPQKNPWEFYHGTLFTFNVPDFTCSRVRMGTAGLHRELFSTKRSQVKVKEK